MRTEAILLFVVGLFVLGCITPPAPPIQPSANVPGDLDITYSYGACHAEWGRTEISINSQGRGIYVSGSGSRSSNGSFQKENFRKTFKLNESELLGLVNDIEKSGYYSLNDYYTDPGIMDGSCNSISITKNNTTKTVSVSNTQAPAAYSKVADLISNITRAKTE